jgi:hypothetical protein
VWDGTHPDNKSRRLGWGDSNCRRTVGDSANASSKVGSSPSSDTRQRSVARTPFSPTHCRVASKPTPAQPASVDSTRRESSRRRLDKAAQNSLSASRKASTASTRAAAFGKPRPSARTRAPGTRLSGSGAGGNFFHFACTRLSARCSAGESTSNGTSDDGTGSPK